MEAVHGLRQSNRQISTLQMTALTNSEAKKKFEFLDAVSGTMDAHLRYFKQVNTQQFASNLL
jgi:Arf-GAP/coiled-coil/ANK repeat/PH domain-containing protein